jgi:hypothetical protein
MSQSLNSVQDIWGDRTPFIGCNHWPERVDYRTTQEPQTGHRLYVADVANTVIKAMPYIQTEVL